MCIEVAPNQSVIGVGEKAGEARVVVGSAGAGGRDVNVDDFNFASSTFVKNARATSFF